jgi:hypothetical protein
MECTYFIPNKYQRHSYNNLRRKKKKAKEPLDVSELSFPFFASPV